MENEIMKFEEVMEFLSVGKNTLYALLNSGEIQAFRIGKLEGYFFFLCRHNTHFPV